MTRGREGRLVSWVPEREREREFERKAYAVFRREFLEEFYGNVDADCTEKIGHVVGLMNS